jgi:hypothetical protein
LLDRPPPGGGGGGGGGGESLHPRLSFSDNLSSFSWSLSLVYNC